MPKKVLKWVQDRWDMVLEPVLRTATVDQEEQLRVLWERELAFWKTQRGIDGDSLRNPLTNVRTLIRALPLTDENSYLNDGQREHIGLDVFNLEQGEWVSLNDRQRLQTQKRLVEEVFIADPDIIVQRALPLLLSDDWAELAVGIAICTGRRLGEVMKTGIFTPGQGYTLWFEGQLKASHRPKDRFELPTLLRSFLVLDAVAKLRQKIDCTTIENDEVSQKYGKAVNETVDRIYRDMIPVRVTKESEASGPTMHVLRGVYAHIAVLWFDPPPVDPIEYMAEIQGHRFITHPKGSDSATAEEIREVQNSYASHANYADYQILTANGEVDGRRGTKLGQPAVTVLETYQAQWQAWLKKQEQPAVGTTPSRKKKSRAKPAAENKTGSSLLKLSLATRSWYDELMEVTANHLHRSLEYDELLRRVAAAYVMHLLGQPGAVPQTQVNVSLEQLDLSPALRDLLQKGAALAGSADLLSFLLAAGEREARQLRSQAQKSGTQLSVYASMTTTQLKSHRTAEATQEHLRRAVYSAMQFNAQMKAQGRENDLWFLSTFFIHRLTGSRRATIAEYLDLHHDEIQAHHEEYHLHAGLNRKATQPDPSIVMDNPLSYPWGRAPEPMDEDATA